ncbi:MAG: hypothetical protein KUG81_03210 [Gammaproteobacteria bacterium]|nr:hypothetical protein [Gammaproteobacteria bacterium]
MEVLFEPAVITSLLVSLFIAMLSKRLTRLGEYFISHISLLPKKVRTKIRVLKWRYRKTLILTARNQHNVTWAIVRTYTFLMFFVVVITLYLMLITIGPLKGIGNLPASVQAFIASPIYIFEVLWLLQKYKAQVLVKVAGKRVTKPSI